MGIGPVDGRRQFGRGIKISQFIDGTENLGPLADGVILKFGYQMLHALALKGHRVCHDAGIAFFFENRLHSTGGTIVAFPGAAG